MKKEKICEILGSIVAESQYQNIRLKGFDNWEIREALCQTNEIIENVEQEDIDNWVNEVKSI